jgi:hypothetical protein
MKIFLKNKIKNYYKNISSAFINNKNVFVFYFFLIVLSNLNSNNEVSAQSENGDEKYDHLFDFTDKRTKDVLCNINFKHFTFFFKKNFQ